LHVDEPIVDLILKLGEGGGRQEGIRDIRWRLALQPHH
jgi:hypothetical protein